MAEEEGFEPPVPLRGTAVFKTARFNHSRTPPPEMVSPQEERGEASRFKEHAKHLNPIAEGVRSWGTGNSSPGASEGIDS